MVRTSNYHDEIISDCKDILFPERGFVNMYTECIINLKKEDRVNKITIMNLNESINKFRKCARSTEV